MDRRSDIELNPLESKRTVTIEERLVTGQESSKRDAGQTYGHSTGSSGRGTLEVSELRETKSARQATEKVKSKSCYSENSTPSPFSPSQ